MTFFFQKNFSNISSKAETLFLLLAALLVCGHGVKSYKEITDTLRLRKAFPYIFRGHKFLGLESVLGSVEKVGYYTDKSLDDRITAMEFAQAQFVLAPTVLELNNLELEYVLLNCSVPDIAWSKIKEMGGVPLRRNQYGIILARNPSAQLAQ